MGTTKWTIATLLILALALQAGAQDKPKRYWVTGKIKSVDEDGMGFTAVAQHPKELGEMTCRLTPKCKSFHLYMPGTKDDLKDGVWVKVYGKVSDDGLTVEGAKSIVTLTYKSKGFISSRLDGQVKWQGDDLYVDGKKGLVKIEPRAEGYSVTVSERTTKEAIKDGVRATFGAIQNGETWDVVGEMRFYVPRPDAKK